MENLEQELKEREQAIVSLRRFTRKYDQRLEGERCRLGWLADATIVLGSYVSETKARAIAMRWPDSPWVVKKSGNCIEWQSVVDGVILEVELRSTSCTAVTGDTVDLGLVSTGEGI